MKYLARDDRDGHPGYASFDSIGAAIDFSISRGCAWCRSGFGDFADPPMTHFRVIVAPALTASSSDLYVTLSHGNSCFDGLADRIHGTWYGDHADCDHGCLLGDPRCPKRPDSRLGHCTTTFGGHSPACDRDGTYCGLASSHTGPCKPHGISAADAAVRDGYIPFGGR